MIRLLGNSPHKIMRAATESKTFALFVAIGLLSLGLMAKCYGNCVGPPPGPRTLTEEDLDQYFSKLSDFKALCGRFPTTNEGLKAFLVKPGTLKCPSFEKVLAQPDPTLYNKQLFGKQTDGWGSHYRFTSDGATYRLEGSHGYYITDHSPLREGTINQRWENPNRPPEEAPKRARPFGPGSNITGPGPFGMTTICRSEPSENLNATRL